MEHWQALGYAPTHELIDLARTAEEAGFAGLLLSDHVFVPEKRRSKYPYSADGEPDFPSSAPFPDASGTGTPRPSTAWRMDPSGAAACITSRAPDCRPSAPVARVATSGYCGAPLPVDSYGAESFTQHRPESTRRSSASNASWAGATGGMKRPT